MRPLRPLMCSLALGAFAFTYSLAAQPAQGPQNGHDHAQTRPSPGGNNNGHQAQRPNPGNNRPAPNPGNNRPAPNPGNRPNPGNNRPSPNPGNRPNPGNNRPGPRPTPSRPPHARPPQWGHRPPQRPSYNFRPNDRSYLHRYYLSRLARVNRAWRIRIAIGGFFPYADISYISPLPPDIYGYLPPPPPGYTMGYYEGYVIIYDPVTFYIANVIDLLQ